MNDEDAEFALPIAPLPNQGIVLELSYRESVDQNGNSIDVLRVRFSDGVDQYVHDLPNGGFVVQNPALQFMAAVGVRPSTIERARGAIIPIVRADNERLPDRAIPAPFVDAGREKLIESVWGPDADDQNS